MYQKLSFLIICLIIFISNQSCNKSDGNVTPDGQGCNLLSNGSQANKAISTFTYDSHNHLITANIVFPPYVTFVHRRMHTLEYNVQGQVIKMFQEHIDSLDKVVYSSDFRFEYDNSGKISSFYYHPDTSSRHRLKYDTKGRLTHIYLPSRLDNQYYRHEYDDNDNCTKSYTYSGDKEYMNQGESVFDDKKSPYENWGVLGWLIGLNILSKNNLTSYSIFNSDGVKIGTYTCDMTYNEKGYPATATYTYEDHKTHTFTYYAPDTLKYNCQ
ncbi:hypothetical protein [Xanthocytophaga flava]|uniref:hypothetical protein n=1 Tax=Xanthocytophaga flava TaxID=3048013 RepID=UPI0028D6592B|nr:hypothetical protein [Xanthocytophaga flavus]MDJ1467958.1 hypothetical protein [Xanthocytophaga flavus]